MPVVDVLIIIQAKNHPSLIFPLTAILSRVYVMSYSRDCGLGSDRQDKTVSEKMNSQYHFHRLGHMIAGLWQENDKLNVIRE